MNSIKIPWAKPDIGQEELNEIIDSFRSNWFTMGPKVKKLEEDFSLFLNIPYAVCVSNGTVALDLALKAIGIKPGDEVIIPAMTYFATASQVNYQYAIPVFVDIERESFNLNPERISEAITDKTRAIIFIDYGGNPADYDNIAKVAREYGISVIQDGAQSLGAIYKGKPAITQSELATTSFHIAKLMTTVEGGMIFTHKNSLKEDILTRRNQGESEGEKYKHITLGTNARMGDLTAAIGLVQLKKLPRFLKERKRVATGYDQLFAHKEDKIFIPSAKNRDSINAYFFYPILINNRDRIAEALRKKYGIDTRIAYPMPVYRQEAYASGKLKFRKMECPIAEEVTSKILNLPIYPAMTDDMINEVCDAIFRETEKVGQKINVTF